MLKIEKWRIQELMLVLEGLHKVLRKGNHSDWANVFEHFYAESSRIFSQREINEHDLRRLVRNIQNCFTEVDSFRNLEFSSEENQEIPALKQKFYQGKARLFHLLGELQARLMEYVH